MDSYKSLEMTLDFERKKKLIFSAFFILQNKMQTKFDKILGEITSKQFIVLVVVNSFPSPPSLTEVAQHVGCSRQNVKKITSVLEKKGYLTLLPEKGTRAVRIVLSQKFHDFYDVFLQKAERGLDTLFEGMTAAEIEELFHTLCLIEKNVDTLLS